MTKADRLIEFALAEVGKPFCMGSEGPLGSPLRSYDCSEFVQNRIAATGVTVITNDYGKVTSIVAFDGSANQYRSCRHIPVAEAVKTRGALLFCWSRVRGIYHVALSLGDGRVVEARGRKWGVVVGGVRRSFNRAGRIDELYV